MSRLLDLISETIAERSVSVEAVASIDAELREAADALNAALAVVPSVSEPKAKRTRRTKAEMLAAKSVDAGDPTESFALAAE